MSEIMRIQTEKARRDPEAVFDRPGDIAKELGLTRGQKLAALKRWESDVTQRLKATTEGMPGNGTSAEDSALLEEIKTSINALNIADEGSSSAK